MSDETYLKILHLLQAAAAEVYDASVQAEASPSIPAHVPARLTGLCVYIHQVSKVVNDARFKQILETP